MNHVKPGVTVSQVAYATCDTSENKTIFSRRYYQAAQFAAYDDMPEVSPVSTAKVETGQPVSIHDSTLESHIRKNNKLLKKVLKKMETKHKRKM
jgi:hypothetical protein